MLRQHGVPAAVLRGIAVSPSGRLCRRGGNSDSARTGTERAGPTFPEQRFLPENCYLTRKMKARVFSPVAVPETERPTFPASRFPKDTISAFVLPLFVPFRPSLLRCPPSRNPPAAVPSSSRISGKGVHPPRSHSTVVPHSSPPARRSSSFRRRAEPQSRRPSTSPRPVGRPRLRGRLPPSSPVPRPSFPPSFPSSAGPGSVAAPPVPPERAQGRFRHAVPPSAPRRRRRRAGTDLRSARSLVAHALFSGLSALRSADTGLHFDLRA